MAETYKKQLEKFHLREKQAKARKAELEVEVIEETVIDRDKAQEQVMKLISTLKTELLDIPGSLAPKLHQKPVGAIKNQLEKSIVQCLNRVSSNAKGMFDWKRPPQRKRGLQEIELDDMTDEQLDDALENEENDFIEEDMEGDLWELSPP